MKLREVDPLEPQPGDLVRIYTPHFTDPDHPMNWDEGIVTKNSEIELELAHIDGTERSFFHGLDEQFGSIYYIVEEA